MRIRAAGALAVASLGFGIATTIFASVAYADVLEARAEALANAPVVRVLNFWEGTEPDPTLPGYPALPDPEHLPESYTAHEREDATIWLHQRQYVDECMAEAGYPQWSYFGAWQTGVPKGVYMLWTEGMTGSEIAIGMLVLFGATGSPQSGASYVWDQNGCMGYGWHMVGIDYPG